MNKLYLLVVCFFVVSITNYSQAQTTAIPDANFEQALIDLGIDSDTTINGQVLTADISGVTQLDISNYDIADLTGIDSFSALQVLNVSGNNISFLLLEFNTQLTSIDLSNNLNLSAVFFLNAFVLDTINLSNNNAITNLDLSSYGNLSTITLNNMSALSSLNIANGNNVGITSFSATGNPNISCIQVDDVAYAETNWTNIDPQTSFSTFCLNNPFITTWQTTTANETITIPTTGNGYFYDIDWGDGSTEENVGNGNKTHTYETPGVYTVSIGGSFPRIYFNNSGDKDKILSIEQWGSLQWTSMVDAFEGCSNLQVNAIDAPDLTGATSLVRMFSQATSLNSDLNQWDTSTIVNIGSMFRGATNFNGNISDWNTDNLQNANNMFNGAIAFNQDISGWNMSNVSNIHSMFRDAASFNQPIGNWTLVNVNSIASMFQGAIAFNQPLNNWDVSSTNNMANAFNGAISFDQSLGNWDIGSASNMINMLIDTNLSIANYDATLIGWEALPTLNSNTSFNASGLIYCNSKIARQNLMDIYGWNISGDIISIACTEPTSLFITTWKTDNSSSSPNNQITLPIPSNAGPYSVDWGDGTIDDYINGSTMHIYASAGTYTVKMSGSFRCFFNNSGDKDKILSIDQWGNNQWSSFDRAFRGCTNLQINATDAPDLSSNPTMSQMFFDASSLNSNINHWDVSNITNMSNMFGGAIAFNQPLNNWDVSSVINMGDMFQNASSFNQSLGDWNISNVNIMGNMLRNTNLSTANYDATLIGWSNSPLLQNNVALNAVPVQYCYSQVERQILIDSGWTITDSGVDSNCPANAGSFITTWQTTTANESITIPTGSGSYNFDINWGDGTIETGVTTLNPSHSYTSSGIYTVEISGMFPQIFFNNTGDKDKIQSIEQWGTIAWSSMANAFYGCSNLVINATDAPDLSNVTACGGTFWEATAVTTGVSNWNVGNINFMTDMFNGATSFNDDISNWNVSNVTHMDGMFRNATSFNQDLNWTTTSLRFTRFMFNNASSFNGDISSWQTATLEEMDAMFKDASVFNQDISGWDTSSVREMDQAFSGATAFNQSIGSWNTGMVTEMQSMFFGATAFNQDLSIWNTANVQFMQNMFDGATAFDQSLATWDVSAVTNMGEMFNGVTLSTVNYDATLIAWAGLPLLQDSVPFSGGNSQYCASEQVRFDVLQGTYNWQITDGGLDFTPPVAICQDIIISLDIYGNATIIPQQIDNGSSVTCGNMTLSLDKTEFSCDDIGDNFVTLTVTGDFTSSSCTATVTVQDILAPDVEAHNQDITLDLTGNATITAEDILRTNGFFAVAKNGIGTPPVNVAYFDYDSNTDNVTLNTEYENILPSESNVYAIDGNPVTGIAYTIASVEPFPNIRFLFEVDLNNFDVFSLGQIVSSTGNTRPTDMSFDVEGNLFIVFPNGNIEKYDFDTGTCSPFTSAGPTATAQGLTYDYDNNQLLHIKNTNPVELSAVSLPEGIVTPLFNFSIDAGEGPCAAQAIEYAGNNKLIASAIQTNGVLCDAIYTVDIITQQTAVIMTPTGTINEIKDILIPYYGNSCGAYSVGIDVTTFNCENVGFNNAVNVTFTDVNGNSSISTINLNVLENPTNPCDAVFTPKVFLQGAALNPNVGEETLMRDDLRVNGLLSTTSPYSDQLTCSQAVFNTTGPNAVVDWVFVELRDETDPTIIIAGQSALLRRNGSITNTNGFPVEFRILSGNYHVVIKHRNHLGIMTNTPLLLTSSEVSVDFTDATSPITFGIDAQTTFGMQLGTLGMWSGNVNADNFVQYSGTTPDSPDILSYVINDPGNFLNLPTYIVNSYNNYDVDMNGSTQYSGTTPDTPFILQNVIEHPVNFLNFSTYAIQEQLPEN